MAMQPPSPSSLAGRAAVVTGSSSGIGRAIALELAAAGADVLVHARSNQAGADETADEIRRQGRAAKTVLCDLADPAAASDLADRALRWRSDLSIWVNNAGVDVLTGDAANWSFEEKLQSLWSVDVLATVQLSRRIGEYFRQHQIPNAAILNMGWDQAVTGMAGDSGELFAAVKGAVMGFTKSLAKSLAPDVRVNCLAPGWIKTAWGEDASQAWQERAVAESLLARWGTPEDVARVARFLVSPEAAFITGQISEINGGRN
jgi:3-oxoacyl-[acyl-carrier protein] reductase